MLRCSLSPAWQRLGVGVRDWRLSGAGGLTIPEVYVSVSRGEWKVGLLQAWGVILGEPAGISRLLCPGTRNWTWDTGTGRNSLLREKVFPCLEGGQWWSRAKGPAALTLQH